MTKIVFIHLDWGIGGAEQLMLQLAMASKQNGAEIQLLTTRCDPDHCFAILKERPSPFLNIYGSWIPSHVNGQGQVLLSTVRLLYLAMVAIGSSKFNDADLIVTDVLPTPLILLRFFCAKSALLFYCHFPDRLLIRTSSSSSNKSSLSLRRLYRWIMDGVESISMDLADTIVVNSRFTRDIVLESFPQLATHRGYTLPVLYPALEEPEEQSPGGGSSATTQQRQRQRLLVSLNRFERKKNIGLLIQAVLYLKETYPHLELPRVIIAGGYDPRNVENVEHRGELGQLVMEHSDCLASIVSFEHSISDARRAELLRLATAVIYTPDMEHFGIVPVEAMAAGTPVICCHSGGPKETVIDGTTGYLCDPPTAFEFGEAIKKLLDDPKLVEQMGRAARQHAISTFGMDRLQTEWKELVEMTIHVGKKRVQKHQSPYRIMGSLSLLYEPLLFCLSWFALSWFLQFIGILEQHESLIGGFKRRFMGSDRNES